MGLLRDRDASTAVEFAIVAPVALFLIYGVFEMARYLYVESTIQQAAATAIRAAVTSHEIDPIAIEAVLRDEAGGMAARLSSVSVTAEADSASALERLTVATTYNFLPVVKLLFDAPLSMTIVSRGFVQTNLE